MKFLMMLLENVPLLLRVHLLHFFTECQVLVFQNLESLVEPFESLQHRHASLLPKHTSNLSLLDRILLHLVISVELRMLIITHCHRSSLLEKL